MNDALDTMQGVLDFLGFLPLFGSAADAINTAMSILRADYLAALLNSVGLMGGIYSNVITAPFKMLLAAADNADKFSAALKTFKAAVGIVGDATSYISNMFNTMKNLILNVTSSIGDVTKASVFGLLSKEMKDKLAGFLEMIGTGISKAMTAIDAQVAELMGKVKVAEAAGIVDGFEVIDGKVLGKVPLSDYTKIRVQSIHNPDKNILVLGKYEGTTLPDGSIDWNTPGPNSYITKAGKTATYFSLGSEWDAIKATQNLNDADMFKLFNVPALADAIKSGKTIKFSHDPRNYTGALADEWTYLKSKGYSELILEGEFWIAK